MLLFLCLHTCTLILFWSVTIIHMCHNQLIARFLFNIKPFLDSHYVPLKDKHRYWFGFLHLVRAAILLVSSLIPADHSSIVTISILASAVVLTLVGEYYISKYSGITLERGVRFKPQTRIRGFLLHPNFWWYSAT